MHWQFEGANGSIKTATVRRGPRRDQIAWVSKRAHRDVGSHGAYCDFGVFALLWFALPNRPLNRLAKMPVTKSAIPVGIVGGMAVGLGLIVAPYIG